MDILHVSLGLPPLRTGGLTRYCSELMEAQVAAGERVALVYPGRFLPGPVRFHKGWWRGVETYELMNPLPVALTFGVSEPDAFTSPCQKIDAFKGLIRSIAPDVVHVHSFMGIYREFFQAVKSLGVPMAFTTHDYYPMCPRCTLIDAAGEPCDGGPASEACAVCCRGGMTKRKSLVMQSGTYARLKSSGLLKKVSSSVKKGMQPTGKASAAAPCLEQVSAYGRLLDYNKSVFGLFDLVLANSAMTEEMYRTAFPGSSYRLVRISHAGLVCNAEIDRHRGYDGVPVFGYFGGKKEYKGFETLMDAAHMLHEDGLIFELRLYGDEYGNLDLPEVCPSGRVAPEEIRGILRGLDAVVVPSICHETFGFVVLEALCEGVPVISSDAVGASELVSPEAVFPAGDAKALAKVLAGFCKGEGRCSALPTGYPVSMDAQVNQLKEIYLGLCRKGVA